MSSNYSHKNLCPLDDPSKELRILEIIDNNHDPIECKLTKRRGDDRYSTLSWCWGGPNKSESEIRIIQNSASYTFSVPSNLEQAIRALRHHREFNVWIDFICMDQDDINEKNYQVPMMASIYGDAACVYVWLGMEGQNSQDAMAFIHNRVLNLSDFDRLVRDDTTVKEWQALSALMKRPWFSRRWIVQEIAVAQKATLLCGTDKIEWKELADAISLFNEVETRTREVSEIMKNNKDLGHMPDFFGDVSQLSATKLVEETNNLFRRLSGQERQAQFTLEYLVSKLTGFESSEPRDTIYALLAIARDTMPVTKTLSKEVVKTWTWPDFIKEKLVKQLAQTNVSKPYHVDYRLPLSDVYVQFVRWAIEKSDPACALDIICRPWAPITSPSIELDEDEERNTHWRLKTESDRPKGEGEDTLPSWIPTVTRAAFGMVGVSGSGKMTRKNADSLVGLPPKRTYSAAGTRVLTEDFRIEDGKTMGSETKELNGLHYHSMFVKGFILDEVEVLKQSSQQGSIPKGWIKMANLNSPDPNEHLSDEFWRTIVADRSPTGENAPRYYPRLVRHALIQGVQGDSLNTKDIVHWSNCSVVGDVLRRVQSAIWNRAMIRTKKDKNLGLVPQHTHKGDLICILYGCSVPVVLRKFTKSEEEVKEENQQRQKKQDAREKEAVRKIVQVWRNILDMRKATNSSRKRKRGSISTTRHAKKRRAGTGSASATGAQAANGLGFGTTGQQTHEPSGSVGGTAAIGTEAKKPPLQSEPDTYYQLIGECYIDGKMNGEALSRLQPSMLFEIR